MAEIEVEEYSHNDQLYHSEEQSMDDSVHTTTDHMRKARDGRHKGVFNGAFPTLHVDDVGNTIEGHTEV